MSETATSRHIFEPYFKGLGIDAGFGGSLCHPTALAFDTDPPYTNVGGDKQVIKGDCRNLGMFCDECIDYLHASHILEDFSYSDLVSIINEWRRVLKPGGYLLINCPDQQKFLAHIEISQQGNNLAHLEQDFSLETFKQNVLPHTSSWEVIFEEPNHGPYSWLLVLRKI